MLPHDEDNDAQLKDTVNNIRDTEEFVINTVPEEIAEKMEKCATNFPPETDEFDISGLTPVPSKIVAVPRVSESPINFECKLNQIIEVGDGSPGSGVVVLGTIIMYHIKDDLYDDGRIDQKRLNLIGRLGGNNYTRINDIFTISRQSTPPK